MIANKSIAATFFSDYGIEENNTESLYRDFNIRMTRLRIPKEFLKPPIKEVVIALYFENSKHPVRSTAIPIVDPASTNINEVKIDIDFSFSLKYSHCFRHNCNFIHVALQKNQTYRKKLISAFKTFAVGDIDLARVIQCGDLTKLFLSSKNIKTDKVTIEINGISSIPVEKNAIPLPEKKHMMRTQTEINRNSSQSESEDTEHLKVEDTELLKDGKGAEYNKSKHSIRRKHTTPEETLTKVLSQLKIAENVKESILTLAAAHVPAQNKYEEESFDDSFSSLEDYCETYHSNKPLVRPHFQNDDAISCSNSSNESLARSANESSTKILEESNLLNQSITNESTFLGVDIPVDQPPARSISESHGPKHAIETTEKEANKLDSFENITETHESCSYIPEDLKTCFKEVVSGCIYFTVVLASTYNNNEKIKQLHSVMRHRLLVLNEEKDIRLMFNTIIGYLQNFQNASNATPLIKICILGREPSLTLYLQELSQFSMARLSEILQSIQFLIIPVGKGKIASYIGKRSKLYSSLFLTAEWKDYSSEKNLTDLSQMACRIISYAEAKTIPLLLPISEICLNCSGSGSEDQNSVQINIPFILSVNIGYYKLDFLDPEYAEYIDQLPNAIPSPSFNDHTCNLSKSSLVPVKIAQNKNEDKSELTIDYWINFNDYPSKDNDKKKKLEKKEIKISAKGDYRYATIYLNNFTQSFDTLPDSDYLSMDLTKYANAKIQFNIKRKIKEVTNSYKINQLSRIVCATKSHVFTVEVDGRYWNGVKFFSVSPKWPTNMKSFRLGIPST